jgi:hypothetical protein
MPWKCLPIAHDTEGKAAIHDTTISKVFARWADDGSLWQAFRARVRHGDGPNTVAKTGAMA